MPESLKSIHWCIWCITDGTLLHFPFCKAMISWPAVGGDAGYVTLAKVACNQSTEVKALPTYEALVSTEYPGADVVAWSEHGVHERRWPRKWNAEAGGVKLWQASTAD